MGYDHSWKLEAAFTTEFLDDVKRVVEKYKDILNVKELSEDGIFLNGIEEKGYESFKLMPRYGNWCKTDAREYDEPVCAILLLAIHHYKENFSIGSAGLVGLDKRKYEKKELWGYWNEAIEAVKEIFGYEFELMDDFDKEAKRWNGWYSFKIIPKA